MNKTAIKKFAVWARNKLIADITYKAGLLGITEKEIKNPLPQSTQTVHFFDIGTKDPYSISGVEIEQRKKLVEEIQRKANQSDYKTAYKSVIEEVAYTWFNRLIAIRFMEVNNYLPTRIRVLSSESNNKTEPDLVTHPMEANFEYTPYEKDRIMQLKHDNRLDELFRMLFIKQCNALNAILPELFEKTSDFTELLLNVSFTDQDGVVYHLVNDIPEDDFNVSKAGQVEIIGWMYQYYNTEPKDETFALLKKNMKITKERIPAATQLFTPDWIVRYMVENSLGRLWLEGHPNKALKSKWKHYLDAAEQETDVQRQLDEIREEYKKIKPGDIKVIDPCMGSGHILVYAFDVLMQIYESYGYSQRDAAKSIIENNLYGLDIDNRAYQFAYFAVMMKARQYNRRILNDKTTCHVYSIRESNSINRCQLNYFGAGMSEMEKNTAILQIQGLLDTFIDAKEYGSILNVDSCDWQLLYQFVEKVDVNGQITMDTIGIEDNKEQLLTLVEIGELMAQTYYVVVTNPPYMGSSGMSTKLSNYVKNNYLDSKSDLFAVFLERCGLMTQKNGYQAMVTMQSWMFLSSFAELRKNIINNYSISSLVQIGYNSFPEINSKVAQAVSFVLKKTNAKKYIGMYLDLTNKYPQAYDKELAFLEQKTFGMLCTPTENFSKIPGMPIAYWISSSLLNSFEIGTPIGDFAKVSEGIKTGDNEKYLRYWFEISLPDFSFGKSNTGYKWFPHHKGGEYRKWYGNLEWAILWENDGMEIRKSANSGLQGQDMYFGEICGSTKVSSKDTSMRYYQKNILFDSGAPSIMAQSKTKYVMALINSHVGAKILRILNPTLGLQVGNLKSVPVIFNNEITLENIIDNCIHIAKTEWDLFETSWDFIRHPLLNFTAVGEMLQSKGYKLKTEFQNWQLYCESLFDQLKTNEEELNRIFIDLYGLQEELCPGVLDKNIIIRKADLIRDIRSFISYAVGCMFGRYSLDAEGLVNAGGDWDDSKYSTFIPDKDNIIPITDEEYFEDDVVGLFCAFLKKTFGPEMLEENLDFIAKALGNKGNSSRETIRNYFLKDFYKNHCKIYQKRPIYWLFDSGKADGFKALVYMHRYNENTIGNMRIDYLHRMQRIYDNEISRMQETIENSKDAREVTAAIKRKEKLVKQLKENKEYDEKIAHLALARTAIDLDDGVKVNYEKVQTDTEGKKLEVLAKI